MDLLSLALALIIQDQLNSHAMNYQAGKSIKTPLFIACGMYAFTDKLRNSWQNLFEHFINLTQPSFEVDKVLKFEPGQAVLHHPSLWFGHTCGYPLMTRLRDSLMPINVPIFDVAGCDQKFYSSYLIVPANSNINSLQNCRGLRAVINASDSNSGMNVLRHAISRVNHQGSFFSAIRVSGSHLQSLTEIANHRADIAAIDCISYRLIEDAWPELTARVRSIGFTEKTCGLPFVMPRLLAGYCNKDSITENLNRALSQLNDSHKKTLHLKGFAKVDIDEYQGILDLEISARKSGYPEIS